MRNPMRTVLTVVAIAAGALAALPALAADDAAARGKYLVESVSMCGGCHTPEKGAHELDMDKWLQGREKFSPNLTPGGRLWKTWGEDGIAKFLQTGLNPKGHKADPPMPQYRLSADDAQAVVAYLKTLK